MSNSYRDLIVWQKAKQLAVEVYQLTDPFPIRERFGLSNQMRRAAVSVSSNIAEGQGRTTVGEFQQFLGYARGSLLELETQLEIAAELSYASKSDFQRIHNRSREVLFLLNRLISGVRNSKPDVADGTIAGVSKPPKHLKPY